MSQQNVDAVRALWAAFARREVPAEAFAHEVEWHESVDMPDRSLVQGVDGIRAMLARGWENVADPSIEVEALRDAGDWVVVRWRATGTGRASGLPIEWVEAHTYRLLDGKVVTVREYRTWAEALASLDLEEGEQDVRE
jgi:ketosteroid isomerase-like protein